MKKITRIRDFLITLSFVYICLKCINAVDDLIIHEDIVNRHDFIYLLNPGESICGINRGHNSSLLVYVHTSPGNFKRRLSIRETWARRSMFHDIRLVFMMGSTDETKINERLLLEFEYYNDIVQENFQDSYRNLTYKGNKEFKKRIN